MAHRSVSAGGLTYRESSTGRVSWNWLPARASGTLTGGQVRNPGEGRLRRPGPFQRSFSYYPTRPKLTRVSLFSLRIEKAVPAGS